MAVRAKTISIMATALPERTIPYKTGIKTALVQGLRLAFAAHPDELLRQTKITIDFPRTRADYPAIIVRFYERRIHNAGIGHVEYLPDSNGNLRAWGHYYWNGDIEFAISALSSHDRDLLADTIVELISMGEYQSYTRNFYQRIYTSDYVAYPAAEYTELVVAVDDFMGYGEQQNPAPWGAEDEMVYRTAYRVPALGSFYNVPPTDEAYGLIEYVDLYPYGSHGETLPEGEVIPTGNPSDPAEWYPDY